MKIEIILGIAGTHAAMDSTLSSVSSTEIISSTCDGDILENGHLMGSRRSKS